MISSLSYRWFLRRALLLAAVLAIAGGFTSRAAGLAPSQASVQAPAAATIRGRVVDSLGKPVGNAQVKLQSVDPAELPDTAATVTDAAGTFELAIPHPGSYEVHAEASQLRSRTLADDLAGNTSPVIELVLQATGTPDAATSGQQMEFEDKPNFTISGVTDWTAVGGHGSDATLRTSEDLARETVTLKPLSSSEATPGSEQIEAGLRAAFTKAPLSYAANHDLGEYYLHTGRYTQAIPLLQSASAIHHAQAVDEYDLALACQGSGELREARQHVEHALERSDTAELHRLAGELDEQLGDPLAAVEQDERAARLDPSEENYFAWGSELLLHRAVWQAAEVFRIGAKAHPASARMLTGWGSALFAGARYDEAAQRLCQASDLNPADAQPYLFMGRIELAAPAPLPCIEQKLADFVHAQPDNATANYLYAMAIARRTNQPDPQLVESLLTRAVSLDPKCVDAYLQLGIIFFAQRQYAKAIEAYSRAIQADPQMAEAHYRLGVAYDRIGEGAKAKQEFALHDEIEKAQADAVEQQRREVKQFLVVLQGQPGYSTKQ